MQRAFADLTENLLSRGHQVCFEASGGSMSPAIRAGEKLQVDPARAGRLRAGDIVLYRADDRLVAHRLLSSAIGYRLSATFSGTPAPEQQNASLMLRIRGDASSVEEFVTPGQVLGVVTCVQRRGQWIRLSRWQGRWSCFRNRCLAQLARSVQESA